MLSGSRTSHRLAGIVVQPVSLCCAPAKKQTTMTKDKRRPIQPLESVQPIYISAKGLYMEQIDSVEKQDPYQIEPAKWRSDPKLFPAITYVDLVNYFIFNPSLLYTLKDFENYKSLEAYDRFMYGWVTGVSVYIYYDWHLPVHVVRARVIHSQRMNATPLFPWIIIHEAGNVKSAHCSCKAGPGETCLHVASVLFYIEAAVHLTEVSTVTQTSAYWIHPSSGLGVEYAMQSDMNFTSARLMKNRLDNRIGSTSGSSSVSSDLSTVTSSMSSSVALSSLASSVASASMA
ncbi:hypothetical protein LSH36_1942g00006 [Paralvinella palmiformis]|uniref:SWIM-type domain-containing protein n=1 Tax=Paralvinella palmiformis TaxID=53620 RepID=A0AAD9IRB0_9ANNE|nr:hypothetical protein LSH36_1942g00006 [Paralvinella palmiformis]